jgi:hypothetical protein
MLTGGDNNNPICICLKYEQIFNIQMFQFYLLQPYFPFKMETI